VPRALNTKVQKPEQLVLNFFAEAKNTLNNVFPQRDTHVETATQLTLAKNRRVSEQQIQVRYSMRAKRMSISVSHDGLIELIAPGRKYRKPSLARIRHFAHTNKNWIDKTRLHYQTINAANEPIKRPQSIYLEYIETEYLIDYSLQSRGSNKVPALKEVDKTLYVDNALSDFEVAQNLGQWLQKKSKVILVTDLQRLADMTGLAFNKVSIRGQKTRWGSCSSKGNISLNYCILLLPKEFGEYVLIHELCHLKEFNHSRRFWALVKQFVPNYSSIDKSINKRWEQLPYWLDLRFKQQSKDEIIYINY